MEHDTHRHRPPPSGLDALLSLRSGSGGRSSFLTRDRMVLLAAIETHGSISAAARACGLSYKAAWDAVHAANNLFSQPVVSPQVGGSKGGGAQVTAFGQHVMRLFSQLEQQIKEVIDRLHSPEAASDNDISQALWGATLRISARNMLLCRIESIRASDVQAEVCLALTPTVSIYSTITRDSIADLALTVGDWVYAVIKASFVVVARSGGPRFSPRNCLAGTVLHRFDGDINSEVCLDIGHGKTLTATVTRETADGLALAEGEPALALFKSSHVILARL